jgi:hypothetical protein
MYSYLSLMSILAEKKGPCMNYCSGLLLGKLETTGTSATTETTAAAKAATATKAAKETEAKT